jgi:NADH dehydrogenase [ubiquinone] 1 alpha subcomplex assembly factor 7
VGGGGVLPLVRIIEAGQSGVVNALKKKIIGRIREQGPINIAQYMEMALGDPGHGYYMTRDPLGRDFITAPEVSQIFGELIGSFFMQAWEDRGKPHHFHLVELGPGRGTLMADIMRAASKVRPIFVEAARIALAETSPVLRRVQAQTLSSLAVDWVSRFEDVPADAPLFLLANEFFDVLPIRQFVKSARGWHERMVTADGDDLHFTLTLNTIPIPSLAEVHNQAPIDSVKEINPAATALTREIARRIAGCDGVALIVDYGHATSGLGDTLQAVRENAFADPLTQPGDSDLTAHVDFAALTKAAREAGASVFGAVTQKDFLEALGIRLRAERLKLAQPQAAAEIDAAVDRLINPMQMGSLFKVLGYAAEGSAPLAGFAC